MIVSCVPQPSILFLYQPLKQMIMEIVNIEAGAFMEMNDILFKIESDRKLLSLRQKGLIPFSRIDRKIYYKKEDILSYIRNNLKTYTNNGNGTAGIE